MQTFRVLFFLMFTAGAAQCQLPLDQRLYNTHKQFKEETIEHRRFKHSDISALIDELKSDKQFTVKHLGESVQGKSIRLVSVGNGPIPVLLWSQMHGNEPTATMALMDIFNFFKAENEFEDLKTLLKKELTIHCIPLLNPDGADNYQRRNAAGIDLNRDALYLQHPETQILKRVRDSLDAQWGYNLHDQSRYYSAGQNPHTASISFLAPAYNYEKDVNTVRGNAMKLITVMNETLQKFIPNKVGKYSDEFEPRAFGDNIQKWGTSTILIESGGLVNDREKQELRRLNYVMMLKSFESIATGSYKKASHKPYHDLPFNKTRFHDFMLRRANVEMYGKSFLMDIAFRYREVENEVKDDFYLDAFISDLGDLHTYFGYDEWDANGYRCYPGKVYEKSLANVDALDNIGAKNLLKQGYGFVMMEELPTPKECATIPIGIISPGSEADEISLGGNPILILEKNGVIEKAIVNGKLVKL